ncbi:AT DNA binding protein [Beauveria bassiana ARSEF 2860]|uniref:Thymocyte nuclear protein 1 n=1 Tax=Beauveria bassiana (strain ARSEF 2860) TaxID=655819 RepID=J4KNQ0_BEAB2|nr:AT DNA binding protein [Beauveria bassiana ARSEF 2860]EJP66089.1 AT DNA binding protein [Beauveria bassiana ARSEF 2860]
MSARKRTNSVADNADEPPIAKRRSSRQAAVAAAAVTASKAASVETDTAVKSDMKKQKQPVKSSSAPSKALKKAKTGGGKGKQEEEQEAAPQPVKTLKKAAGKSGKKQSKAEAAAAAAAEGQEDGRTGSEDPDVDAIPAVNPDAPKHEGEWYWLMKAEPETRMENGHDVRFSIDDLRARTKPEGWDGIRAYPARNNMRNMNVGDKAFFYHSNCKEPGIVGIMEIVKEFSEDKSARRPGTPYYDPSSTKDKPKWDLVHVEFRKKFAVPIYLKELRKLGEAGGPLAEMQMLKLGRLSVSKVSAGEWRALCELADEKAKEAGLKHEE